MGSAAVDLDVEGCIPGQFRVGQLVAADERHVGQVVLELIEEDAAGVVLVVLELKLQIERQVSVGGVVDADADEAEVGRGGQRIDIDLGAQIDLGILHEERNALVCSGQEAIAEAEHIAGGCASAGALIDIHSQALIADFGGGEQDAIAGAADDDAPGQAGGRIVDGVLNILHQRGDVIGGAGIVGGVALMNGDSHRRVIAERNGEGGVGGEGSSGGVGAKVDGGLIGGEADFAVVSAGQILEGADVGGAAEDDGVGDERVAIGAVGGVMISVDHAGRKDGAETSAVGQFCVRDGEVDVGHQVVDVVVVRRVAGVRIGNHVGIFGGREDVNADFIAAVDLEAEDDLIGGLAVGGRLRVAGHDQFIGAGGGNFSADLPVLPAEILLGDIVGIDHLEHLDDVSL